jgi:hypothetical protein
VGGEGGGVMRVYKRKCMRKIEALASLFGHLSIEVLVKSSQIKGYSIGFENLFFICTLMPFVGMTVIIAEP